MKELVCVNPQGDLEIWHCGAWFTSSESEGVWIRQWLEGLHLMPVVDCDYDQDDYRFQEIYEQQKQPPEFWGREVLSEL